MRKSPKAGKQSVKAEAASEMESVAMEKAEKKSGSKDKGKARLKGVQ